MLILYTKSSFSRHAGLLHPDGACPEPVDVEGEEEEEDEAEEGKEGVEEQEEEGEEGIEAEKPQMQENVKQAPARKEFSALK